MKKLLAAAAAAALVFSCAACSLQQGGDYPVRVASYTFSSKPATVVCLSDSVADIMIACGFADKIKGRTDECTQSELSSVESVGTKSEPSVRKIKELSPDVVFADKTVSADVVSSLNKDGVRVLNMITAQNATELETLYGSIGAVMDGNTDGRSIGEKKAKNLMLTMSDMQRVIPETDILPTACYVYDSDCKAATADTFCGKLFEYAGAVNAFAEAPEPDLMNGISDDNKYLEGIKRGNASFIFCDKGVKEKLMENPELASVTAIKNDAVYEIEANVFERQGATVTDTLAFLIETIHPELAENDKDESSKPEEESKPEESRPAEESKPAEESSAPAIKVEADDSLEITDELSFTKGTLYDEFPKVQMRLAALGYYDEADGFTGFFGEKSEEAYKAFQKENGLRDDGKVKTDELKLLFSADVKPAAQ